MKNTLFVYLKLAISIGLFFFVTYLAYQNRELLTLTAKRTEPAWVSIGLLCYSSNYIARAHRIKKLCPQTLNIFPETLKICSLHGFLSYVLPMRAGDFTLPILLRSIANVPLTQGNAIYIRTRLADFFGLGILLVVSTMAPNSILNNYYRAVFLVIGIVMSLFPFLGMQFLNLKRVKKLGIFQKIFGAEHFRHITPIESLISINVWFWTGCTSFCVIKAVGLQLSPFDAWFLAAVQLPLQLLPIQGLANSGTHEAGWIMGLTLLGIPSDQTLAAAIATHVLLFGYILILGAFALLMPDRIKPTSIS